MSDKTIPAGVKAAILRAAAAASYPRQALPTIASHHSLTLDDVKTVVEAHGWPRPDSMRRAAAILEQKASTGAPAAEAGDDDQRETFTRIQIDLLNPDPKNVRDDVGDITELADSMVETGLLQPIVARHFDGKLYVVAGHRRLAAARRLGWTEIPCVIRHGMRPDQVLAAMLIENGQRRDLDPIEQARGLRALKDAQGLTDMQLAQRIGKSQPFVSGRLALLGLTPAQQQNIREGTLSLAAGTIKGRRREGSHRPGAQGKKSAAHLTEHHPLAEKVRLLCQELGHHKHTPGRIGDVGCGRCWETVIRSDERERVEQQAARLAVAQ